MFSFPMSPPQASSFAPEYDAVFYMLLALTVFFTGIVLAATVFFVVRYRRGTKVDRSRPVYENLALELSWTIIPLILAMGMFYAGAKVFVDIRVPPKDCEQIFVIGKQWMWHIEHPNGVRENNTLHVPLNKEDIKLILISQDVLHAFFVPAFRTQIHVVPGRYTDLWFKATKLGEYHLFCNMYCGTQHSEMGGKVVAMDSLRNYANWLANNGESSPHPSHDGAGRRPQVQPDLLRELPRQHRYAASSDASWNLRQEAGFLRWHLGGSGRRLPARIDPRPVQPHHRRLRTVDARLQGPVNRGRRPQPRGLHQVFRSGGQIACFELHFAGRHSNGGIRDE